MIFKAITVPTPKRIKRYFREYATKERLLIYSIVGTGICIIGLNDILAKKLVIGVLIYYGVAYEVIERSDVILSDPIFIEAIIKNQYIGYGMPIKIF